MSWTKGELVKEAYAELALAGYEFDVSPEEILLGVRRLDAMLTSWWNIRIGYAASSSPDDADPNADSGLPDLANRAVYMNLAMELAAGFGKTPLRTTAIAAKQGYDMLLARAVSMDTTQQQYPSTLPRGAGNRWPGSRTYMPRPVDPVDAGPDGSLNIE